MEDYTTLFDKRGTAYDSAMQAFPEARREEFEQLVARAALKPGMRVADVPAGGGYLKRYLPEGCEWWSHEPCESFTNHGTSSSGRPLLPLPWAEASVDVAVSLAGVHHLEDKRPLFEELKRVVRPGGHLVLSDVAKGSAVAGFLDDYVGAHNSTGHEGVYLDSHTLDHLIEAGWSILACDQVDFHWRFDDSESMAAFCHQLFDLHNNIATTCRAIETRLGRERLSDGTTGLRWSLMTIVAAR
ncbi:class I SAM-dependent methyltransferase [Halomonas lysinitropha]|uniref:Methyltransferase type 11 domain-containing protein n=1 Tax=Halomonas lysinitropha TaxID=2607506 RepID=A0A5K1I1A8_9GAMM|nr:methyltransferase domain-containing protein [Halomonas lysinitropha]VVZ95275.1 hypothetical protein HALO32_01340 [Halomonas lysinitropha]